MNGMVKLLLVVVAGLAAGWFSALHLGSSPAFSGLRQLGAWRILPLTGGAESSPYARLAFFSRGELPPSHFNRLDFIATTDDSGAPLRGACAYRLEIRHQPVRWWALSVYPAADSGVAAALSEISSMTAQPGARATQVVLSALAMPGNWLPAGQGRLELRLRLFGASMLARNALLKAAPARIIRGECH